jgi:hypothetical protein
VFIIAGFKPWTLPLNGLATLSMANGATRIFWFSPAARGTNFCPALERLRVMNWK